MQSVLTAASGQAPRNFSFSMVKLNQMYKLAYCFNFCFFFSFPPLSGTKISLQMFGRARSLAGRLRYS